MPCTHCDENLCEGTGYSPAIGRSSSRVRQVEVRCRITGVDRIEHLRASHCKPWRDSSDSERLDGENGLLLTPSIDHLFDRGSSKLNRAQSVTGCKAPPMQSTAPLDRITQAILVVRGQRAILNAAFADLYGVTVKSLLQAVRRNRDRFPADFMFQLDKQEVANLRSRFVTSRRGGRRYPPYAFTEQGVAVLSSVLRSERAVLVNIEIMRAFVSLRGILASNVEAPLTPPARGPMACVATSAHGAISGECESVRRP